MPEGHTIHRLARDHARWLGGGAVRASSPHGRFSGGASLLDGLTLLGTEAKGKHLFHRYGAEGGEPLWTLHVHLGLFGRVRMQRAPMGEAVGQVRLRLEGPARGLDLSGPNTCELLDAAEVSAVMERLGPDPLRPDGDPDEVWAALQRRRIPIGVALMEQDVVAGIGNIYRTELLWLTGVHPLRPARELLREELDALWAQAVHLLGIGVQTNQIITVDVPPGVPLRSVPRRERLNIFKRRRCPRCETAIEELDLRGRRAFCCPSCQPEHP